MVSQEACICSCNPVHGIVRDYGCSEETTAGSGSDAGE